MGQPNWLNKHLGMKPEVAKIFDDLDEWLDHCRFNLLKFDPADLYKSDAYKEFARKKNGRNHHNYKNGERKFNNGFKPNGFKHKARPNFNNQ